ncbi:MAG TPA: serine/threonine-protein kinase [Kofleriaceae bacterium]|jgi:serine/threonine-protein kinase|nr:serine/threonine-protein kinase [Kofleriaceae bacterium]
MLGVRIGNYTIVEKIGEGGMGTVYRAAHETLGRSAAVKMLSPESARDDEMVARLFNEARSATAIPHPGIVEIYDFGFLPDHTAYIIMELLEGESLAGKLRREGGVPHRRALEIVRAVCRTLHVAHEHGIIHRDLKPENIFLVPDPEMPAGERVKLLDFGIAKGAEEPLHHALTETGVVMGTPPYMSPEQCRGAAMIDRRTDLYALGCVLYELLCGRPPFSARSAGEIIAHHLYFRPRSPREHDPRIPRAVEDLVLWLLQKNPDRRPGTAAQVAAAIDEIAIGDGPLDRAVIASMDTMPTLTSAISPPVAPPSAALTLRQVCDRRRRTARQGCRRRVRRTRNARSSNLDP